MIIGVGIDACEVSRVRRLLGRHPERFLARCYTDVEVAYAHRFADPSERLAARFAGKEAVMKSLGSGWRRLRWRDIEIPGGGRPTVNVFGTAAARAERLGVSGFHISISHTGDLALAYVIAEGPGVPAE